MSQTIEQRIVEMRFDNQQFESGVKTSLETLEKLKAASAIKSDTKIFDEIGKAANKLNLSGLSSAVNTISSKFSAFEVIGVGALMKIGSQAVTTGEKLIKSLSVDNIAAGWDKFAEKTTSVGTLIGQGYSMDEVEKTMDRLNWFTDETSYNLTDMIGNISKFTATGQNLNDSATAMQGIALWAAMSGQNASTASRAMYQLSQAMSVGALRQEDYKSIQNASMDTKEFREQAVAAAVALGKLEKAENGLYKRDGKEFTFNELFASKGLTQTRWFDTDVMMKTFKKYSSAVDGVYEAIQAGDFDTASEAISKLGGSLDEFGIKAFKSGQEARTWADVINSVKDAVGTGWMKTFEIIFGNYEEATKLFTELANGLWEIFASAGEARNEFLESWKNFGGRGDLLMGLKTLMIDIVALVAPIKQAFDEIFPVTVMWAVELTRGFKELTRQLMISGPAAEAIKNIFKGFFSIIKLGGSIVIALVKALKPLWQILGSIGVYALALGSVIGEMVSEFSEFASAALLSGKAFEAVKKTVVGIVAVAASLAVGLYEVGTRLVDIASKNTIVNSIFSVLLNAFTRISDAANSFLKDIPNKFVTFVTILERFKNNIFSVTANLKKFITDLNVTKAITEKVASIFTLFVQKVGLAKTYLLETTKTFGAYATSITSAIDRQEIFNHIMQFSSSAASLLKEVLGDAKIIAEEYIDELSKLAKEIANCILEIFNFVSGLNLIETTTTAISKVVVFAESLFKTISEFLASTSLQFGTFLKNISGATTKMAKLKIVMQAFASVLVSLKDKFVALGSVIKNRMSDISSFGNIFNMIKDNVGAVIGYIQQFVDKLEVGNKISNVVSSTMSVMSEKIKIAAKSISELARKFSEMPYSETIVKALTAAVMLLSASAVPALAKIKVAFAAVNAVLSLFKTDVATVFDVIRSNLPTFESFGSFVDFIKDKFSALFPILDSIKTSFSTFITGLQSAQSPIAYIKEGLANLGDIMSRAFSSIGSGLAIVANAVKGFANLKTSVSSATSQIPKMTELTETFGKLKEVVLEFATIIKEKFANLDIGKILAVAFGVALIKAINEIAQLLVNVNSLVKTTQTTLTTFFNTTVTNAIKSVTNGFNTLSQSINKITDAIIQKSKAKTILAIAASFVALAGAIYLLATQCEPKEIAWAAGSIAILAGEMLAITAVMQAMAKANLIGSAAQFALTFLSLAASVVVLTGALRVLNGVPMDETLYTKLLTIASLLMALTAVAAVLNKVAPNLNASALSIVAFAAAIFIIVEALNRLNLLKLGGISAYLDEVIEIMAVLALLALAVSRVSFTSAVGLIATIVAINMTMDALHNIYENGLDLDKIKERLGKFEAIIGTIIILAAALAIASTNGEHAAKAGVALLAMCVSLNLVVMAAKSLAKLIEEKPGAVQQALYDVGGILVVLGTLMIATKFAGEHAAKAGAALLSISVAANLLVFVIKAIADMDDPEALAQGERALAGIGVLFAGLMYVSKFTEKAKVGPIIAMTASIGIIASSLAILSVIPADDLWPAAQAFGIALMAFAAAMAATSAAAQEIKIGTLIAMVLPIGIIAASLWLLAQYDWERVIAAGGSLGIAMIAVAAAARIAEANIGGALMMTAMLIPVAGAAVILGLLASYEWNNIVQTGVALAAVMLSIALASSLATGSIAGAGAMLLLSGSLIAIAAAMVILSQSKLEIVLPLLEKIGIALAALVVVAAASVVFPPLAAALTGISLALLAVGGAAALFGVGATLIANAIGIVVDALIRFGTEGVQYTDAICLSVVKLGTSLGTAAASAIVNFGRTLINGLKKAFIGANSEVKAQANPLKTSAMGAFSALSSGFFARVGDFVKNTITFVKSVVEKFGTWPTQFKKAALDGIAGLVGGFQEGVKSAISAASNLGTSIINGFAEAVGWHSPWSKFVTAASDGIAALTGTFGASLGAVGKAAAEIGTSITQPVKDKLDSLGDKIPLISSVGDALGGLTDKANTAAAAIQNALGLQSEHDKWVSAGNARRGKTKEKSEDILEDFDLNSLTKNTGTSGGGGGGGGGGGAAEAEKEASALDKLTESLKDSVDAFGKYENKIGETGKSLLKNMQSWSTGLEGWSDRIKFLAAEGIDKGLLQKLIDAGPQGVEYVNAFVSMTSEELEEAGKAYNEAMKAPAEVAQEVIGLYDENAQKVTESTKQAVEANVELGESVTDTAKKLGETGEIYAEAVEKPAEAATSVLGSYAEVSGKAAEILDEAITKNKDLVDSVALSTEATESQLQRAEFAYENMRDSLKSVIDSQLDIFSEFKTDTEMTSEQLIQNMESQLNGVTKWNTELNDLISRGINEGLLQNLAQLGPQGYEYVHAFTEMSDEELTKAGDLYEKSLTISDETSKSIAGRMAAAGLNATLGFKQGIASENANAETEKVGNEAVGTMETTLQEHSPSKILFDIGLNFVQGFANGILAAVYVATDAITTLGTTVNGLAEIYFSAEKFQTFGQNIGTGIQNGLNEAISSISAVFEAGGILESYGSLGTNLIQSIITGMSAKTAEAVTTVQTMMTNINTTITNSNAIFNTSGSGLITQLNSGMAFMQSTVVNTANSIAQQAKQKIDSYAQPFYKTGQTLIQKIIDGFKNRQPTVKSTADAIAKEANQTIYDYNITFNTTGETLIERLRVGMESKQTNVVTTTGTIIKAALQAINDTYNDWYTAGQYIIQGLDAGISSMESTIFDHLQRIAAEAIAAAEEECEIESPSKAFYRIGRYMMLGWSNGIDEYADAVIRPTGELASNAINTVQTTLEKVAGIVSDNIDLDPTIRPVLDLSEIQNGLNGMDSMLAAQRSLSMSIGGVNEEGLNRSRPYVIYLSTSTNLDGQTLATSMDTILGEAL